MKLTKAQRDVLDTSSLFGWGLAVGAALYGWDLFPRWVLASLAWVAIVAGAVLFVANLVLAVQDARERGTVTDTSAEIEVVCPGMLEVLSVGKGDIKISVDPSNPEDVANAKRIIEEMLSKGYGIFVETDAGLRRVKKFNPKRMTYVISELPALDAEVQKPVEREVPVAGSRAKAIGRTAGG